jgi:hypothetical protein
LPAQKRRVIFAKFGKIADKFGENRQKVGGNMSVLLYSLKFDFDVSVK